MSLIVRDAFKLIELSSSKVWSARGDQLSVSAMVAESDAPIAEHSHSGDSLFVVFEGRVEIEIEGRCYAVSKGQAAIVRGGVTHSGIILNGSHVLRIELISEEPA